MLPPLVIAAAVAAAAGGSFAALAKRAFPGGTAAVPREITVSRTAPVLPAGTPVHLLAVSDLHYISPKLNDGGEFFRRTVENADGKLTERSEEFLAALEAQTLKERPDALVISGDLTFNGEHQSLRDLKETFGRIREKGVTVLVLPGNHDVSYPMAVNFTGKGTERVKNVSQAEFLEECREFGYGAAEEKDRASFSYYYPLSEDFALLFLDANTEAAPGALLPGTLAFAERVLKRARQKGVTVVTVTHQNVLPQNRLYGDAFAVRNRKETAALLKKYRVAHNLSGHAHLTHCAAEDGLADHAAGCMSLAPFRIARITVCGKQADYRNGILEVPPELREEGEARARQTIRQQVGAELDRLSLPPEIRENLIASAVRFNRAYFSGELDPEAFRKDPGLTLWKEYASGTLFWSYMRSAD